LEALTNQDILTRIAADLLIANFSGSHIAAVSFARSLADVKNTIFPQFLARLSDAWR